ncbi:hypothetical protein HMN09_01388200 [Mycena chlorophos]|uniref:Uncharacterized protein n=1 Tax=Mycena chlorophos TaxID=658473 RepID=A0A8H6RY08_MYCCL|nr:hypothetical protein HMN09_01388200 [Mycena chlorophos]
MPTRSLASSFSSSTAPVAAPADRCLGTLCADPDLSAACYDYLRDEAPRNTNGLRPSRSANGARRNSLHSAVSEPLSHLKTASWRRQRKPGYGLPAWRHPPNGLGRRTTRHLHAKPQGQSTGSAARAKDATLEFEPVPKQTRTTATHLACPPRRSRKNLSRKVISLGTAKRPSAWLGLRREASNISEPAGWDDETYQARASENAVRARLRVLDAEQLNYKVGMLDSFGGQQRDAGNRELDLHFVCGTTANGLDDGPFMSLSSRCSPTANNAQAARIPVFPAHASLRKWRSSSPRLTLLDVLIHGQQAALPAQRVRIILSSRSFLSFVLHFPAPPAAAPTDSDQRAPARR